MATEKPSPGKDASRMKVAIIQSNYLPWKGYFDIIRDVDTFVFYDDVQYTVRDWRNRNKIIGHNGEQWLTVPVAADSRDKVIQDVTLAEPGWAAKHWKTLTYCYEKAPHFKRYQAFFEHVYMERSWTHLSALNQFLTQAIAHDFLGLQTRFITSGPLAPEGKKQDRLLDVLRKVGASAYLSGPAARDYIDPEGFKEAGIALYFKDYSGYLPYPQTRAPFTHAVSIVDMLFRLGPETPHHIWGWRERERVVPQATAPAGIVEAGA
jgi:hypothetical protein